MTNNDLGLMSRETWESLSVQQQTWYLYDALVNKCKDCRTEFDATYEPKKGKAWKAIYLSLIAVCSMVGGFMAHWLGIGPGNIQIGPK